MAIESVKIIVELSCDVVSVEKLDTTSDQFKHFLLSMQQIRRIHRGDFNRQNSKWEFPAASFDDVVKILNGDKFVNFEVEVINNGNDS